MCFLAKFNALFESLFRVLVVVSLVFFQCQVSSLCDPGYEANSVKMVCQAYVLRGVNVSRTFFLDLLRQFQPFSILRYPVVSSYK